MKYEDVDIKGYASLPEHFAFYSGERPHQSLGYRTPADVHRAGEGGATATAFFLIAGRMPSRATVPLRLGQHQTAAMNVGTTA